jgi:Transglycosylase SLT domain
MPRLPDIESLGARPVPESRRRVSSVRNAGALGAAAAGVGVTVSKAGERLDEIHDEDDVRRRDLEHVEQIRVIRDEARQAQGFNAKTAAEQARVKIEALNGRLLASARSKRSRTALEASLLQRSGNELSAITEHARIETTKVLEGSILARRDTLLEEAEEAWDRPEVLEQNLTAAQGEIADWGKWKGMSPEAVALEQRAARAKTRTSVAQRMITSGDYDGALAYVDIHKGDIGHEAENALRATIREPMEEEAAETLVATLAAVNGYGAAKPPQPLVAGNIDLANRPVVTNADGSVSTVRTIGVEVDGKEYVIPTIADDGKAMSEAEAVALFRKTGKHFGAFATESEATAFAQSLHRQQEARYAPAGSGVVGRMQSITAIAESGNKERDSQGRLITSPKGAQGRMQVMPGTRVDPGFGVKPAQNDSDEERTRVGRDYLAAMMTRYGNDPAKAWAAYNWGAGNVDAAIKSHGDGWLAHAPNETRQYVSGNLARLGRGTVPAEAFTPTGKRIDYSAARAEIDALELPYDLKRRAVAALDRRMAAEDRVTSRNEDDATKAALEVVEKLGDGFTSMSQIPANLLMAIPVTARISLASQAQQNALPRPIQANGEAALTLTLQSINDPEGFKNADLRLYRGALTPAEFEQQAATQARMRNEKHAAPTINLRSGIDSTIRFYARDVGLNVDSKSTPQEREQYLKAFNGMERHILSITEGKRAPSDVELKAAFDRVTMEVVTERGDKGRWFEVAGPGTRWMTQVPVPIQTRIINAYRATEGHDPSEGELVKIYTDNKGRPGYWN